MSIQETKLTAIADAIREKDGTSAPIVANDFPDRIRAIQSGKPSWEIPASWGDPEAHIAAAITAAGNDPTITGALVWFLNTSADDYGFAYSKYLYGSNGQIIGGSNSSVVTTFSFGEDEYFSVEDGEKVRWVVSLQTASYARIYDSASFPRPTRCLYVSKTYDRLQLVGSALRNDSTNKYFKAIVFGRPNNDDANTVIFQTNQYIFNNLPAFIDIVNGNASHGTTNNVSYGNALTNCGSLVRYPIVDVPVNNLMYMSANLGGNTQSMRGTMTLQLGRSTTNNFQKVLQNTGIDDLYIKFASPSKNVNNWQSFCENAFNLRTIRCDAPTELISTTTYASSVFRYAFNLVKIEPILNFSSCTSGAYSIVNNQTGVTAENYNIVHIRMKIGKMNCNLKNTYHNADLASLTYLVDNAPDVSATPKTMTLSERIIFRMGGWDGVLITALQAKGWTVAV